MVAQEAEATACNARAYYEAAVRAHYEADLAAEAYKASAPAPVAAVPEGMAPVNFSKADLIALASICSYYKNTNPFPSKDCQRVAASVIERSRGY